MNRKYDPNRKYLEQIAIGQGLDIGCSENPIGDALGVDHDWDTDPDLVADMDSIPKLNDSQDFVVSSHCLEHSSDTIRTLTEWYRLIRPGGKIGVLVPHGEFVHYKSLGDQNNSHRQLFTEITLSKYLLHVGFVSVRAFKVKRPHAWRMIPGIVGLGIKPNV